MVPSTAVMPREGSFALAFFGRLRKVQASALSLSAGRKSFALKRILEAVLVTGITNGKEQIVGAIRRPPDCISLRERTKAEAAATSHRGGSGTCGDWRYGGSYLGLVGDQLAQERNQHDEHNTDREAAGAKLGEEFRVPSVGGDRCGAGWFGDRSREIACKERAMRGRSQASSWPSSRLGIASARVCRSSRIRSLAQSSGRFRRLEVGGGRRNCSRASTNHRPRYNSELSAASLRPDWHRRYRASREAIRDSRIAAFAIKLV